MAQSANAEALKVPDMQETAETMAPALSVAYYVTPNRKRSYRFIKRAFDILASLIGLIVLFPLFLIVSAAIFIDDPGPVLFFQDRIGRSENKFRLWKFRSMVKNAEKKFSQLSEDQRTEFAKDFKLKKDPRITRVGHFIRHTSIDELPQLFNVLKGEMSLIGPRPPLLEEQKAYGQHLKKVMSVRPGLTGYWQVHGRNNTDYAERIEMQEYYIDHQSLIMDIQILFETVKAVFSGTGAM